MERDVLMPFEEAYNSYVQALQGAWAPPEVQKRGTEAYQVYVQALQEMWQPDAQQRVMQAWNAYAKELHEALSGDEVHRISTQAYRAYVQAVKQALVQTDVESLDAQRLAMIGQSILAIAWMAAAAD